MSVGGISEAWQYSTIHNSACNVIEEQTLWGQTVYRVWLPNQDAVVRVPRSVLQPLNADVQPEIEAGRITYVAAATNPTAVLRNALKLKPKPKKGFGILCEPI